MRRKLADARARLRAGRSDRRTRANCDESDGSHPSRMTGTSLKIRRQSPSYLAARLRSRVLLEAPVEDAEPSVYVTGSGIIIVALRLVYLSLLASSPTALKALAQPDPGTDLRWDLRSLRCRPRSCAGPFDA